MVLYIWSTHNAFTHTCPNHFKMRMQLKDRSDTATLSTRSCKLSSNESSTIAHTTSTNLFWVAHDVQHKLNSWEATHKCIMSLIGQAILRDVSLANLKWNTSSMECYSSNNGCSNGTFFAFTCGWAPHRTLMQNLRHPHASTLPSNLLLRLLTRIT